MKFTVVTLFPDLTTSWSKTGLIGAAINKGLLSFSTINPRSFTTDIHKSVDDTAFGGSDGMVLKFEPMAKAIEAAGPGHVVFLSPQGTKWNQNCAKEWHLAHSHVILVCGRYAGFDQRLVESYADAEISIGDYILNGGEVASLVVMESLSRFVPGVLGNARSSQCESFANGLLEAPAFTRPREVNGMHVPKPLLSGNHAEVHRFERDVSLVRTLVLRPDLIAASDLQAECDRALERIGVLTPNELASLGLSAVEGK